MPEKRKTKAAPAKKKVTKGSPAKGKKPTEITTKATGVEPKIVPGVLPR
jgi:hypothetical protein